MNALSPARVTSSRADTQGWRIALAVASLAVAAPWFALGLLLMAMAHSPDLYTQTQTDLGSDLTWLGGGMLIFAAVLVPAPLIACVRARRLRTAVVTCALSAALSAAPVIALAVLLATSDEPFMNF